MNNKIPLETATGIEAEIAAQETAPGAEPWLPPGIDAEIFDPEQLEYLADYFQDLRQTWLAQFYALLRLTPPGGTLRSSLVGINAAILAKLLRLTDELDSITWREMPENLHTRPALFWQQFNLIKDRLRELHPRSANLLEIRLRHRDHNTANLRQYRNQ